MGGFDLAAQWMGWNNVAHCEWNPFCQQILKYYWPNAISYADITKTDFSIHREKIDIVTGGFPCQPFSSAGKRNGKEDDRYLWPEMLRAIAEIQPTWVVGENVAGIRSMGIEQSYSTMESNEIASQEEKMVIEEIRESLETIGYELQPILIPAVAVNAPHRRDRIWFIALHRSFADTSNIGSQRDNESSKKCNNKPRRFPLDESISFSGAGITANSCSQGLSKHSCGKFGKVQRKEGTFAWCKSCRAFATPNGWTNFPTQSPVCDGNDGIPARLDAITFSKWRNESIKAGGNAIVPQVAYEIFKAIEGYEQATGR